MLNSKLALFINKLLMAIFRLLKKKNKYFVKLFRLKEHNQKIKFNKFSEKN